MRRPSIKQTDELRGNKNPVFSSGLRLSIPQPGQLKPPPSLCLLLSLSHNSVGHEFFTGWMTLINTRTMERTEKRYFRLECPLENISLLTEAFDPIDFFQISLYSRPGIHYFIFTRDAELVIARGYARVNHFPYSMMSRDEFLKINPGSGHYIQKGFPALSPWPGKLLSGKAD